MAEQGSYPLNGRTLAPTDTVTGVVTGQTADISIATLASFIGSNQPQFGPMTNRPVPGFIGEQYFDTTLGFMVWVKQIAPAIWVDAAGVPV
jgi:hypothetical protein